MPEVTPRHVLCILGNWPNLDGVEDIVSRVGGPDFELDREFSLLTPDARMPNAFEASYDRVQPSMTDDDWQAVREHSAVAYILSPPLRKNLAEEASGRALLLTAALLDAGGVAAKSESAGLAHGRAHWRRLADEYTQAAKDGDDHSRASTLYWAWVRRPLLDNDATVYYSCGMHLLGHPDAEIECSLELDAALEWIDLLGLYLVADKPKRPLKDGEGFRLRNPGPRRILRKQPCSRYDPDYFLFNPYGYIRLEATEETA